MRPKCHLNSPMHANKLWKGCHDIPVFLYYQRIRRVIGQCDCIVVRICLMLLVYRLCIG